MVKLEVYPLRDLKRMAEIDQEPRVAIEAYFQHWLPYIGAATGMQAILGPVLYECTPVASVELRIEEARSRGNTFADPDTDSQGNSGIFLDEITVALQLHSPNERLNLTLDFFTPDQENWPDWEPDETYKARLPKPYRRRSSTLSVEHAVKGGEAPPLLYCDCAGKSLEFEWLQGDLDSFDAQRYEALMTQVWEVLPEREFGFPEHWKSLQF
ncbi:hypothetical protein [Leptolyngbya sp. FACHB-261]|uniref:hypothetical protein n=1 Tax=Leptolyngbya sp. FACHB-261 TaxID=2692806 RepID=UPI00168620D6|nr:hypothetical protein [Leptolyngbya sp. FACHB-261]MBD2103917.1 hypothetical protein [Leptolyngbya sp. FACHB-261]